MSFPHQIFRAYDIRGLVENELTPALAERVGVALGSLALQQKQGSNQFVIGRDGRLSGSTLADAVMRGISASGCEVIDIGMVPTPTLYFSTIHYRTGNGIQITGSHNPPEYNGMKMMLGGRTLFGDAIQQLKQLVLEGDYADSSVAQSKSPSEDALPAYQQGIVTNTRVDVIANNRQLKVVVDCGNGVAGLIAPQIFRAIGCEVVPLFCEVDGTFPNHHPDPSRPENLRDLIAAVKQHNADFGMAFDGDGDRLGVVSGDGSIIWPDRQMILFATSILAEQPGAEIIFDVKCSQKLPQAIRALGGVATMCKTGHSFIKDKLQHSDAPFAGEMSGHLFFNDRWGGFDDAIYAGARLCEIVASDSRAPQQIFDELPNSVNTPELILPMPEGESNKLVEELIATISASDEVADAEVSTLDGIRVDFADSFGLLRASNTISAISMRFEANTQQQLDAIQSRFRVWLHTTRPNLELPF